MGAYVTGETANILLETSLYRDFSAPVLVRNIGIGHLTFKQQGDGTYTFSGTIEDDYTKARIVNGQLSANELRFQLVYNTGKTDEGYPALVTFELQNSIYGGWNGKFQYESKSGGDLQEGSATCAIIAK